MKVVLHAVGRTQDILPFLALGATLHEVESLADARDAVRRATEGEESVLVILSEEFGRAAEEGGAALVFLSPGAAGAERASLERMRGLITRAIGVDLIAKAERSARGAG